MRTARLTTLLILAGAVTLGGCGRATKRENALLKDENVRLHANLQETEFAKQASDSDLNAANERFAQASARINELSAQLDQAKRTLTAAQVKYAETVKKCQSKVNDDARQFATAQSQIASLRSEVEKWQSDFASISAANDKANAQIAELAKQVAILSTKSAEPAKTTSSTSTPSRTTGKSTAGVSDK